MLETEIKLNQFMIGYCRMLVGDLPDERLAEQPLPGVNHPAWILGHLAFSGDLAVARLGGQKTLPAEWTTLFGMGTKISSTRGEYPSKAALVEAVEERFAKARELAQHATAEQLAAPTVSTNPMLRAGLPTAREGVAFLLTCHLAVHLGQLSAWRRMVGLAPLF
ncbi:MAG: DinB family protein [Planctomycetes bacterium]|nr:DinB family protein [Planctomycetota bacterium]